MNVLIIDDERNVLETTAAIVEKTGHSAYTAFTTKQADRNLSEESIDAIFLDRWLGDDDGLDYLDHLNAQGNPRPVVVFSEHSTVESAVESMRRNAYTFIQTPVVPEQISELLNKLESEISQRRKLRALEEEVTQTRSGIIFESNDPNMQETIGMMEKASKSDAGILLLGPSGTGKTILARRIHDLSERADEPFVTVSCPSLSRELLESELFGHAKGAFTGAVADAWGKVHAAEGGTLFLDEIGELPLEIQPKLLRLLQDWEYERVGESRTRKADIRVISATNRDIQDEVAAGRFREDLLYRLNVISIHLPRLAERPADIAHHAENYLKLFRDRQNRPNLTFSDDARSALNRYSWPGNLREMSNIIERAVILAEGDAIRLRDLPQEMQSQEQSHAQVGSMVSLADIEEAHIREILRLCESIDEAADVLGIDKATLYRKRKKMGLLKEGSGDDRTPMGAGS